MKKARFWLLTSGTIAVLSIGALAVAPSAYAQTPAPHNSVCDPSSANACVSGSTCKNLGFGYVCEPDVGSNQPVGSECDPYNSNPCASNASCAISADGNTYTCVAGGGISQSSPSGGNGSTNAGSNGSVSSGGINTTYIAGYTNSFKNIINVYLVPLLVSIAFIVLLYGVYNYFIAGASKPDKRKEGATFALYGIIGLVIIFSVWGIVALVQNTTGIQPGGGPPASGYPTL